MTDPIDLEYSPTITPISRPTHDTPEAALLLMVHDQHEGRCTICGQPFCGQPFALPTTHDTPEAVTLYGVTIPVDKDGSCLECNAPAGVDRVPRCTHWLDALLQHNHTLTRDTPEADCCTEAMLNKYDLNVVAPLEAEIARLRAALEQLGNPNRHIRPMERAAIARAALAGGSDDD